MWPDRDGLPIAVWSHVAVETLYLLGEQAASSGVRLGGKAAAGLLILTWCLLDINAGEGIAILAKNTPIWLGDEHPNALIFRHADCGRPRAIDK
jgi:hypothetical protein